MVKMRISIREQLGCLVLVVSLVALAVIAVATWVGSLSPLRRRTLPQWIIMRIGVGAGYRTQLRLACRSVLAAHPTRYSTLHSMRNYSRLDKELV